MSKSNTKSAAESSPASENRKDAGHTPGPLVVSTSVLLCDCDARVIASCLTDLHELSPDIIESKANADRLALCWNAHDALVAACKAFVELFRNSDMRPEDECHEVFAKCEAALSLAKEGGE